MGGSQSVDFGVALDKASYCAGETVHGYVQVKVLADNIKVPELSVSLTGVVLTQVYQKYDDSSGKLLKENKSLLKLNAKVRSIDQGRLQDLRQGRACPGAHPRPPGFRRQNLDAHPPGPSKKTKRTPTRPLGKCLSNTPTHPAQRKKAKNGPGRPVPAWKKPGNPIPVGLELRPLDQDPPRLPLNH